jgi:hypothetical protein
MVNAIDGIDPVSIKRMIEQGLTEAKTLGLGTPLGRLMLAGKLTTMEFEAGRRWGRLMHAAHVALDAPKPDPKASAIGQTGSTAPVDPDSEAGQEEAKEHVRIASAAIAALHLVLAYPPAAVRATRALCEGVGEMPAGHAQFLQVKAVLSGLAEFWQLTKRAPRALN